MFYRRNADSQLRTILRKFEQGLATAEEAAIALQRTGSVIELLQVIERVESANLHIDLHLGEEDSVLAPWDLDGPLVQITLKTLNQYYPDPEKYDGRHITLDQEEVFKTCPELEQMLGNLAPLAQFLVSYSDDLNAELSMSFNLISGALIDAVAKRDLAFSRYDTLATLFGPVSITLYFGAACIVEQQPMDNTARNILLRQDFRFSGWVNLIERYLDVVRLGVPFVTMGYTADQWKAYINQAMQESDEVPSYLKVKPTKCFYDEPAEPLAGLCLGLAIKKERRMPGSPDGLRVGSTDMLGIRTTDHPRDLLTWIWAFDAGGPDAELDPMLGLQICLIFTARPRFADGHAEGRVILIGEDIDWHHVPTMTSIEFSMFFRQAVLREARNIDASIQDILWID